MFLKNKNFIFKTRRSKVTDYAALTETGQMNKQYKVGTRHIHFMRRVLKRTLKGETIEKYTNVSQI